MLQNCNLLEHVQIVSGIIPIGLGTARVSDVVSLKNYRRCLVLFHKAIGANGEDPTLTFEQGTSVAFSTNKALSAITTVYRKEDPTTLADVGQWTKTTQAAAGTYTHTDAGERALMWAFDIKAEDLDIANNYDCIRVSINDVGTNTQLGDLIFILYDARQLAAPEDMASAIVD
jgi:hypothetical protein